MACINRKCSFKCSEGIVYRSMEKIGKRSFSFHVQYILFPFAFWWLNCSVFAIENCWLETLVRVTQMGLDFEKCIHDCLPNLCVQLVWLPLEAAIWEQTFGDFSLFLICFLFLLLKVPASMMSKYYSWKFNLVICLLISFHLLPPHFQMFVKRLRMIIPFCFLLKSTWCNIRELFSSKWLILQFRESGPLGVSIDS